MAWPGPTYGRATARRYATGYLPLPEFTNNLRRFRWTDEDLSMAAATVSSTPHSLGHGRKVEAGLERHYQAGADEVAIQVLNGGDAKAFRPTHSTPPPRSWPDAPVGRPVTDRQGCRALRPEVRR